MRWALFAEWLLYALAGAWLHGRGWSWPEAAAAAVGIFLGIRGLIVTMSYGFLIADSSPVPARLRVGMAGWVRMVLEEWFGLLLVFVVIQPFERFWLGGDRLTPGSARPPLLLIHGYQCNRGFWFWLRPRLEAAGWVVATHNLEPVLADIDTYAEGISRRVDEVLAATGASQLILVGHSMGGLASRAYLRRHGAAKVDRLVTLGSPHHGSRIAMLAWGPNGRQMRIGNPWLQSLAKVSLPAGSTSIYSAHDNQVMPQAPCSELSGANNVVIGGVSHLGMAFSASLLAALLEALPPEPGRQ